MGIETVDVRGLKYDSVVAVQDFVRWLRAKTGDGKQRQNARYEAVVVQGKVKHMHRGETVQPSELVV